MPATDVTNISKAPTQSDDPVLMKAIGSLQRMRYFRRQYDQRRAYFYRQYLGQRDQKNFPDNTTPRSNTFVPYPYSNVETVVARVDDAFFSFDPWFECKGRTATDDASAEAMGKVLHTLLHKARLKHNIETLVRNIAIYGHAGIKVDWDWGYETITYPQPTYVMDPQTGQPKLFPQQIPNPANPGQMVTIEQPVQTGWQPATKQVPRSRPKLIPIDVYDLLIDPDNSVVAHLAERTLGELIREQTMSTQEALNDPTQTKQPLYDPDAVAKLSELVQSAVSNDPNGVIIRLAEVWDEADQTWTIVTFGEDSEAVSWKDLRASYRAYAYSPYKRRVYAGQAVKLYSGPIPFNHKRNPILHTSYVKVPNEVFGLGVIETISDLSEALNRFMNMISDNWNMGINRRYAYDTNMDIDHAALNNFNVPGGKVAVNGDPSKVIMPLPTFTPQAGDYMVLDVYKGMIEMASGISDFYGKGIGGPEGNRTASGITSAMTESNFRFKLFIRNLEIDILQPMLEMCSSMVQQYITDPVEILVTGEQQPAIPKFTAIPPEELIGTFVFELVAANYATNKVVRQRTLLELMQMLAGSPYINQYEGIRELAKVFEVRNVNRLLYTPEQVQQMQAQAEAHQIDMMIFESMLNTESDARKSQSRPQKSGPNTYHVGTAKGAGLGGAIRSFAQRHGAHGLGLEGLGQVPGSEG